MVAPSGSVRILAAALFLCGCAASEPIGDGEPAGPAGDGGAAYEGGAPSAPLIGGTAPTGEVGGSESATGGAGGEPAQATELDLNQATIYDNAPGIADWPITTTLTLVEFRQEGVYVEFDKKDGAGRWPDVTPPGWDGPLQYTLGLAELIDGQWVASAAMQYWYGLDTQGGNVALDQQIAVNWYYDARWGELAGRQPATGEIIGVFVVAGNLRGVLDGSQSPVLERSNVVLVPMPGLDGASYAFP